MVIDFHLSSEEFASLDEIHRIVESKLGELKVAHNTKKIGYVAGKVTADGPTRILENLERLREFALFVSTKHDIAVFSAAQIFNTEVYWKLNLPSPDHEEEFYQFWRKVLKSGVTDVFMSPEWEVSLGALDELCAAKELGLSIHFLPVSTCSQRVEAKKVNREKMRSIDESTEVRSDSAPADITEKDGAQILIAGYHASLEQNKLYAEFRWKVFSYISTLQAGLFLLVVNLTSARLRILCSFIGVVVSLVLWMLERRHHELFTQS